MLSSSGAWDGQILIEAAGPKTLEIERDSTVSGALQPLDDLLPYRWLDHAGDIYERDLDAGGVAVMADAEVLEAERAQHGFGALDHREILARDLGAIRNPRSQARRGRLRRARQAIMRRRGAHVGLAEAQPGERRA